MAGLFDEMTVHGLTLKNRIIVSPMCQYQANTDGSVTDWHTVHYGSMALGGAGLMMMEATSVESRGRISEHDVGIWHDDHIPGLAKIVEFAHKWDTKIGIQLGHAGRKADLKTEIVAPSAVSFSHRYQNPTALSKADIATVVQAFADAAERAVKAGFDMVELHGAHGYLIHQFLSPVSNVRTDEYGGSRENRVRFPIEVIAAVRQAVGQVMPIFLRVSGSEYADTGYSVDDMITYCQAFQAAGVDLIDVSSGGNLPTAPPAVYPGYQVPFADIIHRTVGIPVASVGMLEDPVLADHVIRSGRADMVVIGRGFLRDKHWAHNAAKALGHVVTPPKPYERAY